MNIFADQVDAPKRAVKQLHRVPVTVRMPTVLVVEDDEDTRAVVRRYLEPAGWRVEEADNGFEGLDQAQILRCDAVLLDYRLPGIDGTRVLRRLRENGVTTPVVVFSGFLKEELVETFTDFGAFEVIDKETLTPQSLIRTLDAAMSARKLGMGNHDIAS